MALLPARLPFLKNFSSPRVLLLASMVLLAAGCHPTVTNPHDPKFIVAERGSWKITRADLDNEIANNLKQHQMKLEQIDPAKVPALESFILKNIILKKILLEKAATMQLKDTDKEETAALDQIKSRAPNDEEFNAQLKAAGLPLEELKTRIHEDVLIHHVLETEAYKNVDPSDQEISDFYTQHKDKFNLPAKVRASRVVVLVDPKVTPEEKAAKKKIIDQAYARVKKGEDFSKVATEVSEDQYSKSHGGDIGYFQKGETGEPQLEDVAFATKVNAVSPIFETSLGYEFLKVTETHPAGVASIAEARPYIAKGLRQEKMKKQEDAYVTKVLASKDIVYHLVLVELPASSTNASPADPEAPPVNAGH